MTPRDRNGPSGFLGGRIRLRQPARGHRVGTDAAILAAAAPTGAGRIADLGAGVGAVGLAILARDPGTAAMLVEIAPDLARIAAENAAANGVSDRCTVIVADLLASGRERRAAGLLPGSVDLVASNPPYAPAGEGVISGDDARAAAHVMPQDGLERWIRAACDLLSPQGEIVLIHRADALPALLTALRGRFGGFVVKPVHPRAGAPAHRILLRARKGSRAPFSLSPPLILHGPDERFTAEAEAIHRGDAPVRW